MLSVNAQHEKYVKLPNQNITLYYEDVGSGNPIIFIPGWTMTSKFFKNQQSYFKDNYRVIAYDPRGQGKSSKTSNGNTYATHADDLDEMIKTMGLKDVVLVGWSSGCATIYEYVNRYGTENLSHLVFIDEPPKWIGNVQEEWVYGTFEDYRGSLKSLIGGYDAYLDGIVDWMLVKDFENDEKEWMLNEMRMTPKDVAISLYIDGLTSDYNDVFNKLNEVPMLFMVREAWYPQVQEWLKINAAGAKIKAIQSHAAFWEYSDSFNAMLESFVLDKP
jgi:pimeloyl-ACP methyl ester carboxylesterase